MGFMLLFKTKFLKCRQLICLQIVFGWYCVYIMSLSIYIFIFLCLLSLQRVMQFFAQILVALEHVHSHNIMHRDLKTQNIMLCKKKKVVKIGDFGISKVLSSKITSAKSVSIL